MLLVSHKYPAACCGEPMAGFPKGRRIPLVEGGVNAPPENASVQGGRRSSCREFTLVFFEAIEEFSLKKRISFFKTDRFWGMSLGLECRIQVIIEG